MPFSRPTLRELITRFRADIRTYTEGGDALLRRSVESVLARIVPGLTHGLYGYLAWIGEQLFPDRADPEQVLRWANLYGLSLRPATYARGEAEFATDGTAIPVSELVRRADGVEYEVTASSVGGGVCTVELVAVEPGSAGNALPATPLVLVSPVAGVASEGEVAEPGIRDGVDVEDVESLRARVVHRMRNPPRGGTAADYEAWALEVPGVTRVWVTPRVMGAGTVGVMFATDGEDPPIPDSGKVAEVQAYLVERAPATIGRSIDGEWVGVVVSAPTPLPLEIEIADLEIETGAVLADVQAAIEAEIVDFLFREARPGKDDGSVILYRSRLDEAISAAVGERSHRLVSPAADIVVPDGELPILHTDVSPIVWS